MAVSAKGIEAGRAYMRLLLDSDDAEAGLRRFEGEMRSYGSRLALIGAQLGGVGAVLAAPLTNAVRVASDARETFSRLGAVLGSQAGAARQFIETFSGSRVQSLTQSADAFASLFSQLSGGGLAAEEARWSVEQLVSAAADFESFANLRPGEGLQKISSALAGEVEPLRRFGIELSALRVDGRLREQGVAAGAAAAGVDKLRARVSLLLEDFKRLNILGDVERTAGGFANQLRAVSAASENLQVELGSALLPLLERITPALVGAIDGAARLAHEFPEVTAAIGVASTGLAGTGVAITAFGLSLVTLAPLAARGAVALAGIGTAIWSVVSLPIVALAATLGLLSAGIYTIVSANRELEESNGRLNRSFEKYVASVQEAANYDAAAAFSRSEEAASRFAQTLAELAAAQRELNELEASGRGDSAAASNLRVRIPILSRRADQQEQQSRQAARAADPVLASERFRATRGELEAEIAAIDAAAEQTNPERENALRILEARREGLSRRLGDLGQQGDPAVDLIRSALREQVQGGTAADPSQRLAELRQLIHDFERFYASRGQSAQAAEFRRLGMEAAATSASPIGGRHAPVLPGTVEGDAQLRAEAERRADLFRRADEGVAKAREALLETEHQRQLARIERERRAAVNEAEARGSDPQTVNLINEAASLQVERANRDETSRRQRQRERIDDRTAQLRREAELAEINSSRDSTDIEKRLSEIAIRAESRLGPNATPEQRRLAERIRVAEEDAAISQAEALAKREADSRRRQAQSLDVSDLFTQTRAAAFAIGPGGDIERRNFEVNKRALDELKRLRALVKNRRQGIMGD